MGFLRNMFSSRNSLDRDEVIRPEDIQNQIDNRENKSLFEKISEKASSVVNGLRGVFQKKAMRVLDPSLKESLRSDSILVVKATNGDIVSTRNVKRRDSNGRYGTHVDTFRQSRNGIAMRVPDSIWGKMHKEREVAPTNPQPSAMKRTGTDSGFPVGDSVVQRFADVGVSREHSLLSLKYGIELSAVEKAFKDNGRSAEQLMFGLVNRINRRDELGVSALVGKVAGKMFSNGEVDVTVLQSYITDLESVGVSKDELKRVVRDTAAYAYLLDPKSEVSESMPASLSLEPANDNHERLFDGFDDVSSLPEIDVEPIENGLMEKLSETSFSGESEVRPRTLKLVEEDNFENANDYNSGKSDSSIVTLEEFSDELNASAEDELRQTMEGDAEYYSMAESEVVQILRKELEKAREIAEKANEKAEKSYKKAEIANEKAEKAKEIADNATRIAEEAIDQANQNSLRIDGLELDVNTVKDIGMSLVGRFMQPVEELIQDEIPEESQPEIKAGMFGNFSLVLDDNKASSSDFSMPTNRIDLGDEDTDVKFFNSFSSEEVSTVLRAFPEKNQFKHRSGTATYAPLKGTDKN